MSLSPSSSTLVPTEETSPTTTGQERISSPSTLESSSAETRNNSTSPLPSGGDGANIATEEEMDREKLSTSNLTSTSSPSKSSEIGSSKLRGEYELSISSPILSESMMDAATSRSPNASRMAPSTSPLPATTSPVPKTHVTAETHQQLMTSICASPAQATPTALNGSTNCIPPVTTDDLEEVMMELNNFDRQHIKDLKTKSPTIPPLLEGYLQFIAKGGNTHFSWTIIKGLFKVKLNHVISEFYTESPTDEIPTVPNVESFDFSNVKEKLFQKIDTFSGIPFTIQRLAELLTSPKRHYRRTDKFLRALEKNMLVVSTVEARIAPPVPDQMSQFPPPHHLPASLHSSPKPNSLNIFENGPADSDTSCHIKESEQNGPSSRLKQNSPNSERNGNGLSSSLNTNVSSNRSLTALENSASGLNVSPNQCSNVTSVWSRSPNSSYGSRLAMASKDALKNVSHMADYEDEEEEEDEEDDDGEDMELNVGTPGDSSDLHLDTNCSSEHMMGRRNIENTQNSISSSMDEKKSNDVNPSISSNECKDATGNELRKSDASSPIMSGDHEVQKRKAVTSSLAADDGIPNKVFIGEKASFVGNAESNCGGSSMVSSASEGSDNGAKENHSFKESAKNNLSGIGSSPSSGGMTITPCTESSASEYNDAIKISETAVTISKSIEHKKNSTSPTSTKEVRSAIENSDVAAEVDKLSDPKTLDAQKTSDKTSIKATTNKGRGISDSTTENSRDALGVNEIDSSISKSVVLSSGDDTVTNEDEEEMKEDAMEVDTECTVSESHIQTTSTVM